MQKEVRIQGFEQFKAEEVLQQFKEMLKERDDTRDAETVKKTVDATLALILGAGSPLIQMCEAQIKRAVSEVTKQATNMMRDIAEYELVPEQTHTTTISELFRLAEAQQAQEKAQTEFRQPEASGHGVAERELPGGPQTGSAPRSGIALGMGMQTQDMPWQQLIRQQVDKQLGGRTPSVI